jgi:diguanylate cyclase (GGDEF)-like protein
MVYVLSGRNQVFPMEREKILVTDDDQSIREMLLDMIQLFGYECRVACDAEEALKILQEAGFSIVISDIKMPEMDGISLTKLIKEKNPEIDVMIITGYDTDYTFKDVIRAGASDFVTKPFSIDEIEAKLNRIIRERNLKRELNEKNEELQRLSIRDSLTGLYNQRHFYAELEREAERTRRQKHSLSLILFDVDQFKKYNDTYGHLEGDKVLKKIGEIVQRCIRKDVDSGYRYGGDEFAVITPETDQQQSAKIGERILKEFRELNFSVVALSMGIAEFDSSLATETVVKHADEALYQAKGTGGNQMCISSKRILL